MIISHQHKFIFIKPHKTAGTSIELLLTRVCGPNDVITPLGFDPDANVRAKNDAKEPQNYFRPKPLKYWEVRDFYNLLIKRQKPNLNYREHLNASAMRKFVGEEVWNTYRKISIVRNPWDHAISQHNWMSHYGYGKVNQDFTDFLLFKYQTLWPFLSNNDLYCIDHIIRYEHLNEDWKNLQNHFDVMLPTDVPFTKTNTRKVVNYADAYNEYTREVVRKKNLSLLDQFPYSF